MKIKLLLTCLLSLVLTDSVASTRSAISYVKAVDIEATDTFSQNNADYRKVSADAVAFDANTFDVRHGLLPEKLTQPQLEALLQENFMGSYIFYKRLNAEARQQDYQQYRRHPGLDDIRAAIIRLGRKAPGDS